MKPGALLNIVREYGVRWAAWRGLYSLAMKTGYFRRGLFTGQDAVRVLMDRMQAPAGEGSAWLADCRSRSQGGFFLPGRQEAGDLSAESQNAIREAADSVLRGEYRIFSTCSDRGFPPNWFQGQDGFPAWPHDRHWTSIADLGADNGDIKYVWELSRFSHAYDLGRAYLCTGAEKYAEGFWQLFQSWCQANPLETGVNWRCGQEMSFRILAWTFALNALEKSAASTPERVGNLIAHIWHHALHVEKVNWYAVQCVRNNHAVSEAVALQTVGTLLPFLPEATRWRGRAVQSLIRETSWQIYADGTYVQQSNNYARLVVQLLSWSICLAEKNGPGDQTLASVRRQAGSLLDQLLAQLNSSDGKLPNYGSNDGTLLLPWTSSDYRDFRPSLHALSRALGRPGLPGDGPWQEEAFWLGLPPVAALAPALVSGSVDPVVHVFPAGGLNVIRGDESLVFFRCGPNANRPAESDMLHVDYWYKGVNILLDAGTFGYNVPRSVRDYFAGSRSHNTVTVNGADQMRRGERFLWHDWVQGSLQSQQVKGGEATLVGSHRGYAPVAHKRSVHLRNNGLLVVDELSSTPKPVDFRLHWLLNDLSWLETPGGLEWARPDGERVVVKVWCDQPVTCDIVRNDPDTPRGVSSPNYGVMSPAWSWAAIAQATAVRFVTFAGPASAWPDLDDLGEGRDRETVAAVLKSWQANATPDTENDLI